MCEKSCGETGPMHFSTSAERNLWQPRFIDQRCIDYSDGWLVGGAAKNAKFLFTRHLSS